jgi:hypothetical protein
VNQTLTTTEIVPTTITNTQTQTQTQTDTTTETQTNTQTQTQTSTQTVQQPYGRFEATIILPTTFTQSTNITSSVGSVYNGVETVVPNISETQTFNGYTAFVVNDDFVMLGASQVTVTFNGLTIVFSFPTSPTSPNAPSTNFAATFPSETITGFYETTYP